MATTNDEFNVLVVDDEPAVNEVLCSIIEEAGHRCFSATSGNEALGICQKQNIHLVFTDYSMPGMDGVELCAKINSMSPEIPTVIVSGRTERKILLSSLRNGAYDFIDKPFESNQIRSIVNSFYNYRKEDIGRATREESEIWNFYFNDVSFELKNFDEIIERLKQTPLDTLVLDLLIQRLETIKERSIIVSGVEIIYTLCHALLKNLHELKASNLPLSNHQAGQFIKAKEMIFSWKKMAFQSKMEQGKVKEVFRDFMATLS